MRPASETTLHCTQNDLYDMIKYLEILFVHSHYNDVIMGAMGSQITSLMIVYRLFRHRLKNTKAPSHWPLWGEFTGEFPTQRASNAENVSDWWRHNDSRHLWRKHYQSEQCLYRPDAMPAASRRYKPCSGILRHVYKKIAVFNVL